MTSAKPFSPFGFATREQWKTLFAAQLGWMLDSMDVMFYAFALTAIRTEFNLSGAEAGALASVTLLTSAAGGVVFGIVADRFGRTKALMYSILTYSVFTALTATSSTLFELILWRSLVGFGLGGEWSAGSVLVSEVWTPEHRGKAVGFMQSGWAIGYIIAAVLAAAIMPHWGWRVLFAIGVLPAFLTFWIRRHVPESEQWKSGGMSHHGTGVKIREMLSKNFRRLTILASSISTCVLFGYWGLFTWVPTFLASPTARGGAGLSMVQSSTWIVPMQVGAFFGYLSFGFLADRFGRKPIFAAFLIGAAALVPFYGQMGSSPILLMILGPFIGFFGHGYFSAFGAMLTELFPTRFRGIAQGFTYNIGRASSALAPFIIGAVADLYGIGSALAITSAFFILGASLIYFIPETAGKSLE
ncbi:MAG TPA: MFS transporter [Bacteroidota bacterium]|nr:MFS transporter [Bacteroidota bacterium]